ncbi:TetR/AcrR family transcriptional regulator [Spirillospora sp. CA-294931]|uniref:TetR/AcrR family transcriptional regulator n=1 Tax=Spirillospora sp. CA-294931 TaxID=3240042 RepID=UPI003D922DA7
MARPRAFDEETAVAAAVRTFQGKGYRAASTQDLCEATGLGRSSIYNTFSSKHELFLRALVHYTEITTARQIGLLEEHDRPVMERLRRLFAHVVEAALDEGGCLSVISTVELSGDDPQVAEILRRDQRRRLDGLRFVLGVGRRDGEITSAREPVELAHFVVAAIAGLRVAAQGGADRATLESIAGTTLDALSP